ncbi:MAG: DUF2442 domain-containing protein [Sphingobacteriales bacterium]
MKIIHDYTEDTFADVIEVASANYIGDYAVRVSFNDGTEKLIDFKPFLFKSLHPSISKYKDETLFGQFNIIDGNLNWNDFDLIFPVYNLYKGIIE